MTSPVAIIERYQVLRAARTNYEREWEDIARLIRPLGKGFMAVRTEGEKRHKGIYDSSPLMALEHFKAGLYSSMTPQSSRWFDLQHMDEDLNEFGPVKQYFSTVTMRTWKSFGPGVSKFYNQVPSCYASLGSFGTGIMYSAEIPGQQMLLDRTRALHECFIDTDDQDQVDTLYRVFQLTARACAMRKTWKLSPKIQAAAASSTQSGQKFWIIHAVQPRSDRQVGGYGHNSMAWTSCYVALDEKALLEESGYYEFPYFAPRWDIVEGERYGRGPGHVALADVKSLNIARRSNLNIMDRVARPTLLGHSELDLGGGVAPYPGETVLGAVNDEGKRLLMPMDEGKNVSVAIEMESQIRDAIKDAFYFGLMQITGSNDMTATEFTGRDDERQRLLGPYLGNVETELLSPMVKRRVAMLERAGQLPPMPDELKQAGGGVEVRYISPLAKLQRQRDGEAANKVVISMSQAFQMSPGVADRLDVDKLAELLADGFGADVLNTRDVADKLRAARQQQATAQSAVDAAPGLGRAAKDVAQANQAGGLPPQLMGITPPAAPVPA